MATGSRLGTYEILARIGDIYSDRELFAQVLSVIVEQIALAAYNSSAVRTEATRINNFINGEFIEPISGRYLDNTEPATGKPYSHVADGDAHDVDLAVAAAEKAFRDWSKKTATERSTFLLRIAELIEREDIRPAPYVGRYKWVILDRLDAVRWDELQDLIRQSYEMVAAKVPGKKFGRKRSPARRAPRTKTKRG